MFLYNAGGVVSARADAGRAGGLELGDRNGKEQGHLPRAKDHTTGMLII